MKGVVSRELDGGAATPWHTLADAPDGMHPFFQQEISDIRNAVRAVGVLDDLDAEAWLELKRLGLSDADLAAASGVEEHEARAKREASGVRPTYRRVDSCGGEVEATSNYY